jgi:hypothetical protein
MFKGKGLKPGAFQLWVRGSQRAPPHLAVELFALALLQALADLRHDVLHVAIHKLRLKGRTV